MGGFIVSAAFGSAFAATIGGQILAFAINMVVSSVISSVFAPDAPSQPNATSQPNPGNRQQAPPAGDNKLPVVYGTAYVGGTIIDMSISSDNQDIYWVFALSEVTNTETGGTPDTFSFGQIYWGGKKVVFNANGYSVNGLLDESTNETQDITGYMDIYLYKNGSSSGVNTGSSAITIMSASNLIYKWDSSKLMSNTVFAIVHIKYSQSRNLVSLNQTRFQITNSRTLPGDCFLDYLTSTRYGAAIPVAQIDTNSLIDLNTYSSATIPYTTYTGGSAIVSKFAFNGTLLTNQKIMQNIQNMANCCDCLVRYNEITSQWGVIVQKTTYTVAMEIDNTNTIGGITVSPIDISNSFNIIETKFPDGSEKDSFLSATFDLAQIDPSLLFPNEPVNKQSVNLYLVNNNVTAQYLAIRMLKAAREDLQIQIEINFTGLQLDAGDIVTVTNANYGWTAKLFRITKVTQKFSDTGTITAQLFLSEFNPAVFDDMPITQFTPSPNTGISSPITFGTVYSPEIAGIYPSATNPTFAIRIKTSSAGISEYANIYYSAYQFPNDDQLIFAGTTAIQPAGVPYVNDTYMPDVYLYNISAGNWYFFCQMVNNLASSNYSLASDLLEWRPTTFQYAERYLSIAYADDIFGTTNFSFDPTNRLYYGISNQSSTTPQVDPVYYNWYLADPAFGTNKYLLYINRNNQLFSFDTGFAAYASGSGAFVPTDTLVFDPKIWSALPNGTNIIDLGISTGQFIGVGNTTTGTGQIKVTNTVDGQVIASLDKFLDFGGPTIKTGTAATLTIDIYGRVVGFEAPDDFFMTIDNFTATSGQTVFSVTRNATYIEDQCLVFQNGCLLNQSEYTDTSGATGTITLSVGATLNDRITIISFRAISTTKFYANTSLVVSNVSGSTVTYDSSNLPFNYINAGDQLTFSNVGTPTTYTVASVNYATYQITFTGSVTASIGDIIYTYRAAGSSYPVFSRFEANVTNVSIYTPTEWAFNSGYELPFLNGNLAPDADYDIVGNTYTNTPSTFTGNLSIIQFNQNNTTTPAGTPVNIVTNTVIGQTTYTFAYTTDALNIYANGVLLVYNVDYTPGTGSYTLANVPNTILTTLQQQTFSRAGAA